jgi:hypothetical protein
MQIASRCVLAITGAWLIPACGNDSPVSSGASVGNSTVGGTNAGGAAPGGTTKGGANPAGGTSAMGGVVASDANSGGANPTGGTSATSGNAASGANAGGANSGGANPTGGTSATGGNTTGGANAGGANLGGANLGSANLGGANPTGGTSTTGGNTTGGANAGGANQGGASTGGIGHLGGTNSGGGSATDPHGFTIQAPISHQIPCGQGETITLPDADWICTFNYAGMTGFVYIVAAPIGCSEKWGTPPIFSTLVGQISINGQVETLQDAAYDWGGNHHNDSLSFTYDGKRHQYSHSSIDFTYRACQNMDCLLVHVGTTITDDGCTAARTIPEVCSKIKADGTYDDLSVDKFAKCPGDSS